MEPAVTTMLSPPLIRPCPEARPSRRELAAIIHRMRHDMSVELRTETLACDSDVAPWTFVRAFKALTGLSPQRFRAALRIERAKQLLVDTDWPITEISALVGYESLGSFVRTFTLLVGVAPGRLRRLSRGVGAEELVAALPDWSSVPSARRISVEITARSPHTYLVAGLFPQGLPAGLPFDGRIVDGAAPSFFLDWPLGRTRACLLAAEVGTMSLADAWAGRVSIIAACNMNLAAPTGPHRSILARLRPLDVFDPPFLTPVPLLLMLRAKIPSATIPA